MIGKHTPTHTHARTGYSCYSDLGTVWSRDCVQTLTGGCDCSVLSLFLHRQKHCQATARSSTRHKPRGPRRYRTPLCVLYFALCSVITERRGKENIQDDFGLRQRAALTWRIRDAKTLTLFPKGNIFSCLKSKRNNNICLFFPSSSQLFLPPPTYFFLLKCLNRSNLITRAEHCNNKTVFLATAY